MFSPERMARVIQAMREGLNAAEEGECMSGQCATEPMRVQEWRDP
jgi:hypothetical protein